MRERRWRRENLFNPYIVLADVTIATIVIFVVLLISSEVRGEQARRKIQDISDSNEEIKEILKTQKWSDGFAVRSASGPTTLLIRIDRLWDRNNGEWSPTGWARAKSVIDAIEPQCRQYKADNKLIEIRVEGHCDEKWTDGDPDRALDLSLERAKVVRRMFPDTSYVSVSGFGAERPAYSTTPAIIRDQLAKSGSDPELRDKLTTLDNYKEGEGTQPPTLTPAELSRIEEFLEKDKKPITDRIDIVLVYHGISTDNNFVYPSVPSDSATPPDWVNDVSWPKTDERFLRQGKADAL